MKKRIIKCIVIFLILTIIAVIINYHNFFLKKEINWDFISIFIGNGIVVLLYYITYCALDKRNIEKSDNQIDIAHVMLSETYKSIQGLINVWTQDMVKQYVVPKVDFNKPNNDEPIVKNIQNNSFLYDDHIFEFAKEGIISDKEFAAYIHLKHEFMSFINLSIPLFDHNEYWNYAKSQVRKAIKEAEDSIK